MGETLGDRGQRTGRGQQRRRRREGQPDGDRQNGEDYLFEEMETETFMRTGVKTEL